MNPQMSPSHSERGRRCAGAGQGPGSGSAKRPRFRWNLGPAKRSAKRNGRILFAPVVSARPFIPRTGAPGSGLGRKACKLSAMKKGAHRLPRNTAGTPGHVFHNRSNFCGKSGAHSLHITNRGLLFYGRPLFLFFPMAEYIRPCVPGGMGARVREAAKATVWPWTGGAVGAAGRAHR